MVLGVGGDMAGKALCSKKDANKMGSTSTEAVRKEAKAKMRT